MTTKRSISNRARYVLLAAVFLYMIPGLAFAEAPTRSSSNLRDSISHSCDVGTVSFDDVSLRRVMPVETSQTVHFTVTASPMVAFADIAVEVDFTYNAQNGLVMEITNARSYLSTGLCCVKWTQRELRKTGMQLGMFFMTISGDAEFYYEHPDTGLSISRTIPVTRSLAFVFKPY